MKQLKNQRGFTLIELAIVLVIIGIIVGAIFKGIGLIESARAKRFINDIKQFEVLAWTFFEKKGYFPGANNENPKEDLKTFPDAPTTNAISFGGYTCYVWFGRDNNNRYIIAVTNKNDSPGTFSDPELAHMKAFDAAIDGEVDAGSGRVRAATSANVTPGNWYVNNVSVVDNPEWPNNAVALVYYFDRRP